MKLLAMILGAGLMAGTFTPVSNAADHDQHNGKSKAKTKPYTLKTCIVSGEKLGEMGKPYVHTHKDREIKFCCKSCLKGFNKDPEKYIKAIEAAEKKK